MTFLLPRLLAVVVLSATALAQATVRPWNQDTIYFALTDRFFDGDPANNIPAGSDPALYDKTQTDIGKYHGGDLRGLELALQRGYFKDLGITALWISPPVKNVWNSIYDLGGAKTGYHGYWGQDFLDIDPHLVSAKSLDGKTDYPDSRDGHMQHYKDFVALAHSQGIKVIQDVVLNHTGPVFYYDVNGDGKFDSADAAEWIQPFKRDGFYANAQWADNAAWNQRRAEPAGPLTILDREVHTTGALSDLAVYGRKGFSGDSLSKSDGEEVQCDFFSLRDLWTAPGSAHFDRLVNEFVEIYAFYIETIGIDGLRIDTVKHVHHKFWDTFTQRLRARLGVRTKSLLLFGEVYDGAPENLGNYTYRLDWPVRPEACLDSLLNFTFCFAAREYLRPTVGPYGESKPLEKAFRAVAGGGTSERPNFNPTPGPDGLNARQKVVNFIENHDGLNRFRSGPITERQNLIADALALTVEGIPCLYYGTEAALADPLGKLGKDSETGRITLVPAGHPEKLDAIRKSPTFTALAAIEALRRTLPALTSGKINPLWSDNGGETSDDGVFAYGRYIEEGGAIDTAQSVIVVLSPSEKSRSTSVPGHLMRLVSKSGKPLLNEGQRLQRLPISGIDAPGTQPQTFDVAWDQGAPQIELILAPLSVNIYRVVAK